MNNVALMLLLSLLCVVGRVAFAASPPALAVDAQREPALLVAALRGAATLGDGTPWLKRSAASLRPAHAAHVGLRVAVHNVALVADNGDGGGNGERRKRAAESGTPLSFVLDGVATFADTFTMHVDEAPVARPGAESDGGDAGGSGGDVDAAHTHMPRCWRGRVVDKPQQSVALCSYSNGVLSGLVISHDGSEDTLTLFNGGGGEGGGDAGGASGALEASLQAESYKSFECGGSMHAPVEGNEENDDLPRFVNNYVLDELTQEVRVERVANPARRAPPATAAAADADRGAPLRRRSARRNGGAVHEHVQRAAYDGANEDLQRRQLPWTNDAVPNGECTCVPSSVHATGGVVAGGAAPRPPPPPAPRGLFATLCV